MSIKDDSSLSKAMGLLSTYLYDFVAHVRKINARKEPNWEGEVAELQAKASSHLETIEKILLEFDHKGEAENVGAVLKALKASKLVDPIDLKLFSGNFAKYGWG